MEKTILFISIVDARIDYIRPGRRYQIPSADAGAPAGTRDAAGRGKSRIPAHDKNRGGGIFPSPRCEGFLNLLSVSTGFFR
jgi:hypothetical protein